MSAMASQITSVSIVCSTVGSGADQRKHQSSASLVFVWEFTGGLPAQKASNAENVFIWWRHHVSYSSYHTYTVGHKILQYVKCDLWMLIYKRNGYIDVVKLYCGWLAIDLQIFSSNDKKYHRNFNFFYQILPLQFGPNRDQKLSDVFHIKWLVVTLSLDVHTLPIRYFSVETSNGLVSDYMIRYGSQVWCECQLAFPAGNFSKIPNRPFFSQKLIWICYYIHIRGQ